MSGYKRVSFYELCRLCASSIQKEKTHIFQEDGRKIQLQSKIQTCLSLSVNEDDFLPKVVCTKCIRQLEICSTFREECLLSESMLSTYFKNYRYTDDFKKSGKVYIKDTKPQNPPTTEAPTSTTTNVISTANNGQGKTSNNQNQIETLPFYTLQLPTIVSNPNISCKPLKSDLIDGKIPQVHSSQNQVAYNLNLLNPTALKTSMPLLTKEVLNNIIVNSNGEIINISQLGDLETVTSQVQTIRSKKSSKTKRKHDIKTVPTNMSDENVIKIDLTNDNNYDLTSKYDKLPHIKSTQSTNNRYNPVPKIDKTVPIQSSSNTNSTLNQTPTVIFPVSEYQNNFSNYNTLNSTYSQSNSLPPLQSHGNIISNSNVICNTSTGNVEPLSINLSLQELQNNYTVISSNTASNTILNSNVISANPSYNGNSNVDHTNSINISQNVSVSSNNNIALNVPQSVNVSSNNNNMSLSVPQNVGSNNMSQSNTSNLCQNQSDSGMQLHNSDVSQGTLSSNDVKKVDDSLKVINNNTNNNHAYKTHVCDICHKSFKRREHLYQHVKLHTGFRPYRCEICNKAFMRKEHLFRHSTLHSGQKNHPCDICGKSFSRNDNLLKHRKTHEKQASYTCEICQKVFVMKHYYQAHRQTHGDHTKCFVAPATRTWETCKT